MTFEIRSIYVLTHDEIVRNARQLAESGEPCAHGYAPGSVQARTFERNYLERKIELETSDV